MATVKFEKQIPIYANEIIDIFPLLLTDESRLEVFEVEKYQDFYRDELQKWYGNRYYCISLSYEHQRDWIVPCRDPKLEAFLKNGNLYDITIKAGEKLYKLHRAVLNSESLYFKDIFSKEYSELAAQCEGTPPIPPSKDKIYFMDDIDSESLDTVVDCIYKLRKREFTSDGIVRLFKAAHVLKIENLKCCCNNWLRSNSESICAEDVIEMLNFTREHIEYKSLNQLFLSKYVVDSWPKIDNLPQFADLFEAIALPTCEENEVYLSDKTDQETFKLIIDYMYLHRVELNKENIWHFLKATEFFNINKLVKECAEFLLDPDRRQYIIKPADDVVEVLKFARRNIEYCEVLNGMYLAGYMMKWPHVDLSLFCSISYDCLENLLTSPEFFLDDPREIFDMCSKWVMHDVENRYRLIPRIALAISQNLLVDCDDYPISNPVDFHNCSQEFIKDKLREIFASTSVLPSAVLSKNETKMQQTQLPVFITMDSESNLCKIFDSNWDEIKSFHICKYAVRYSFVNPTSACVIDDNIFILSGRYKSVGFHVFNFSLKKLFSLASDVRLCRTKRNTEYSDSLKYNLLNYRNELYDCLENGEIFKYSFELNRWMRFAEPEQDKDGLRFASDGKKLYRMFKTAQSDTTTDFIMEEYNIEQKSWIFVPNSRLEVNLSHGYPNSDENRILCDLIHLKDNGFAALFEKQLFRFDSQEETWREIELQPYDGYHDMKLSGKKTIIGQKETGQMLYVINNKLYCLNRSRPYRDWELVKEWPIIERNENEPSIFHQRYRLPYTNIVAIHNPSIHA